MINLTGHAALITGSTQGIGAAMARHFALAGAQVIRHGLVARGEEDKSLSEDEVACPIFTGDLAADPAAATARLFLEAIQVHPSLDILVCNAGTCIDIPFLDMGFDQVDQTFRLNVYAPYFLCQVAARYWIEKKIQGRILLTGSINGVLAEPDHTAYDASKGAVEMLVKSLCVAMAPHGIRVNGIAPGLCHTPLTSPFLNDPKNRAWMEQHTPNGNVPNADVCGQAAVFLVSDGAEHIHGQMLRVDGGMSAWQQPDPPA